MSKSNLWTDLPLELRNTFEANAVIKEYKRGDSVYRQGDKPQGIYFVHRGLVGLLLLGAQSGKEHLMRFFKEDQFFGHRSLFSDEGYHGSAVVLQPTTIKFISKEIIFQAIDKNPKLLHDVVRVLSKELRRCENHQLMILENQILPRVAQSLIYLKDIKPDHNWTRQEVANFCASTVSTVIKAMAELENMNLIKQVGRSIEIIDRNKLLELQDMH